MPASAQLFLTWQCFSFIFLCVLFHFLFFFNRHKNSRWRRGSSIAFLTCCFAGNQTPWNELVKCQVSSSRDLAKGYQGLAGLAQLAHGKPHVDAHHNLPQGKMQGSPSSCSQGRRLCLLPMVGCCSAKQSHSHWDMDHQEAVLFMLLFLFALYCVCSLPLCSFCEEQDEACVWLLKMEMKLEVFRWLHDAGLRVRDLPTSRTEPGDNDLNTIGTW